jgi:hypothetical protein
MILFPALLSVAMNCPHPQPLYLKTRETDRHPLDARHRGEARVISLMQQVKLESSVGTVEPA